MSHSSASRPASQRLPVRYRLQVLSRTLAATAGGYLLAATSAATLGLALAAGGMAKPHAVTAATMVAFIVYVIAALWAFACANAWRAWAGILIPALLLAAAGALLLPEVSS